MISAFRYFVTHTVVRPAEVRRFLVLSVVVFGVCAAGGYAASELYPRAAEEPLQELSEMASLFTHMSAVHMMLFIFANNSIVALFASFGGIAAGFLPLLILIVNGFLVGIVYSITVATYSSGFFFAGILPHGVIELPAIFFATALGLWLGWSALRYVFLKNESRFTVRNKLKRVLYTYLFVVVPLLFVAALIEAFVTPGVLSLFIDDPGETGALLAPEI